MALNIISGKISKPSLSVIYGTNGIGKTTLAMSAPSSIMIDVEGGSNQIDCHRFERANFWEDIVNNVVSLIEEEHDFKTLVLDSIDEAEKLCFDYVCRLNKWKSIEDAGFGKGYTIAGEEWSRFLSYVSQLQAVRGMNVIFIAHNVVRTVNDPTNGSWDRHEIALNKRTAASVLNIADFVGFLEYRISTKSNEDIKKTSRALPSSSRILRTRDNPGCLAKTRFSSMPSVIEIPNESDSNPWDSVSYYMS